MFIHHRADLASLADTKERGLMDVVVEGLLNLLLPRQLYRLLLTSPQQRHITSNKYSVFCGKTRMEILVMLVLWLLAVSLVMAPVALLNLVPALSRRELLVVGSSTLLFTMVMGAFTKARRPGLFAAAVA